MGILNGAKKSIKSLPEKNDDRRTKQSFTVHKMERQNLQEMEERDMFNQS